MKLDAYVSSDMYRAGTDEDGEAVIAEVYFIMAEAQDGRRWVHPQRFYGAEYFEHHDEECGVYFGYADVREDAEAQAVELLAKVLEAGTIDLTGWRSTYSAYGSASYSEADTIAWEREIDSRW